MYACIHTDKHRQPPVTDSISLIIRFVAYSQIPIWLLAPGPEQISETWTFLIGSIRNDFTTEFKMRNAGEPRFELVLYRLMVTKYTLIYLNVAITIRIYKNYYYSSPLRLSELHWRFSTCFPMGWRKSSNKNSSFAVIFCLSSTGTLHRQLSDNCLYTPAASFSPCPGVSIRAKEGLGHQQHKHETVCQSNAHSDRCQTQV